MERDFLRKLVAKKGVFWDFERDEVLWYPLILGILD
jgi:hypothetical protein